MLNLKDIGSKFLKNIGDIRILEKSEEIWYFRVMNLMIMVAYHKKTSFFHAQMNENQLAAYKENIYMGEKKHCIVFNSMIFEQTSVPEELLSISKVMLAICSRLTKHNIRLVLSVIKNDYLVGNISLLDILNEGLLNILKTIGRFDYTRNLKFSTYTLYWINQGLYKTLHSSNKILGLPVHIMSNIRKAADIVDKISNKESLTKLDERKLRRLAMLPKKKINLEMAMVEEDSMPIIDSVVGYSIQDFESEMTSYHVEGKIKYAMEMLPMHQRMLIGRIYGFSRIMMQREDLSKNDERHLLLAERRIKVCLEKNEWQENI